MSQGFSSGKLVNAGNGITQIFVNGVKQAATSGTSIDFSIPSGVKKVVITGDVVSTSGSDNIVFQIGDATSVKTSGYGSTASYVGPSAVVTTNYGAGLYIRGSSAGAPHTFTVTWVLHDAATNTWVGNMIGNWTTANYTFLASGSKALDSELTTVRMTSGAGSVTFDAGSINVQYDNPNPALVGRAGGGPTGSIFMWPTGTPPAGFLELDGSSKSTTTYAALFNVIGYTYGGSGANFTLPDMRGQFPRGWDNGAGTDPDAASRTDRGDGTTGDVVGSQQADDVKDHSHVLDTTLQGATAGGTNVMRSTTGTGPSTKVDGGTPGNETRPTNIALMYIIKT